MCLGGSCDDLAALVASLSLLCGILSSRFPKTLHEREGRNPREILDALATGPQNISTRYTRRLQGKNMSISQTRFYSLGFYGFRRHPVSAGMHPAPIPQWPTTEDSYKHDHGRNVLNPKPGKRRLQQDLLKAFAAGRGPPVCRM